MAVKNNLVDRRQFLKGSFAVVFCAVAPVSLVSRTDGDALNLIIEEIRKQDLLHGYQTDDKDIFYLKKAYNQIMPQNHLEYAVTIACGRQYACDLGIIDEYLQRKIGRKGELYNHKLLELNKWCVPKTYGLLIFKEQELCLLQELISTGRTKAVELQKGFGPKRLSFVDFYNEVDDEIKTKLGVQVIYDIFHYILSYSVSMPYYWCSNIIMRAGL